VTEAVSLLAAAGFNQQNPLKFTLVQGTAMPEYDAGAQLTQAQWKRLSNGIVDAALQVYTGASSALLSTRAFTYAFLGGSALSEPDAWLSSFYHTGGSQNFAGFSDTTIDGMIDQQRAIFDSEKRKALVKQIVLYLIDHGVSTVPSGRLFLNGVAPNVQAYSPEYWMNGRQYQNVWFSG
jgi:ABC-type transport system substrate-binding protein